MPAVVTDSLPVVRALLLVGTEESEVQQGRKREEQGRGVKKRMEKEMKP